VSRPFNSAAELELVGTPSHILDKCKKSEDVPLPASLAEHIRHVDKLIGEAIEACGTGQQSGTKRNPAFQNLELLIRVRKRIIEQARLLPAEERPVEDLLEETNRLLGKAN
jgi:hypothetical protein